MRWMIQRDGVFISRAVILKVWFADPSVPGEVIEKTTTRAGSPWTISRRHNVRIGACVPEATVQVLAA
jgi:hypothetical protein